MSMTSADLRSLLTLVYKLVFLSVGLYMVLSGRLGVNVFDTLSKAVASLLAWVGFCGLRFVLTVGPMVSDRKM